MMTAYNIDSKRLKESRKLSSTKDILKIQLLEEFLKATAKMDTPTITEITGLHKSDISRLRAFDFSRFSTDRLATLLDLLGLTTSVKVSKKRAS